MRTPMHRVGIIPFDIKETAIALLFVTSQTRGRWILPKGLSKKGETHHETCQREGFEEAGIKGIVLEDFPLTVLISKTSENGKSMIPATYYPYLVTEQVDSWPEMNKRERHWALIEDAPKVVYREDFLNLIRQFGELRPWITEVATTHKSKLQEEPMPVL
ncbi:MAG: NUDIX hydrolase [Hyphomicrobiales bacterium]